MSTFDPLTLALEEWFDTPLSDLPDALRQRVEQEFFPMPWDKLTADQRRSVALQLDYQHDPANEQDQKFWWEFFERVDGLKKQLAEWELVATPSAADLALKETRLAELKQELARMDAQKLLARGDYYPARKPSLAKAAPLAESAPATQYVAYPRAIRQLTARLGATPEELAAWIWLGPNEGGIAAYMNANELDPPPRFFYANCDDSHDYIAPLMACWFKETDIDQFVPADRYITGKALIDRWSLQPGLQTMAFIQAKITESRLLDLHPIYGGTRGRSDDLGLPPLESGLFPLSQIQGIEAADFSDVDDLEGHFACVQKPLDDEHIAKIKPSLNPIGPTGVRSPTLQRTIRKLKTQQRYASWRKAYRKLKKEHPGKSEVWHSLQIAKMEIGRGVSSETIRKRFKIQK